MIWSNFDNQAFYEKLDANGLQKIAISGGLYSGCDVEFLRPYWQQAKLILDVGSGYGRVIDNLLKRGYKGEIVSLERSKVLFQFLNEKYLHNKKIQTLEIDLHDTLPFSSKFHAILWLWSGIADFSAVEQASIVSNLAKHLEQNGKLIIDTMIEKIIPINGNKQGEQYYTTNMNDTIVHTYEPTYKEISHYAQAAGLQILDRGECVTAIGRKRALYILGFKRQTNASI